MSEAQKRLDEIAAQRKALADEEAKLLAASKDADLKTVKKLCKQHGFTATQLRGYLRSKGKAKAGSAARKPAAKKTAKAN
jgi:DNA-binding protein H-NS